MDTSYAAFEVHLSLSFVGLYCSQSERPCCRAGSVRRAAGSPIPELAFGLLLLMGLVFIIGGCRKSRCRAWLGFMYAAEVSAVGCGVADFRYLAWASSLKTVVDASLLRDLR